MTRFATRLRPKSAARLLLTLLVLAAVACSRDEPDAAWPDAAVLVARSDSLRRVLGDLTQLAGTPIARSAAASMARLPDCEIVQARAPSERPGDLFDAISCRETPGDLDVVDRARGARDLLIAVPDAEGSRIQIAADVGEERIELTLDWPAAPMRGALSLLLPGDAPAGPGELSPERRLAHMRVRPAGGLDLAGLVPAESQADRLFGLRSELFAGLALDGTWEAAIYLPEAGHAVPRSALALGIGVRSIALLAIERFVDMQAAQVDTSRVRHGFVEGDRIALGARHADRCGRLRAASGSIRRDASHPFQRQCDTGAADADHDAAAPIG